MWIFLDSTDILVCLEKNVFKVKIELFLRFNKNPEDNFLSAFHLVFFTFSLQSWLSKIQFSSQQTIEIVFETHFFDLGPLGSARCKTVASTQYAPY